MVAMVFMVLGVKGGLLIDRRDAAIVDIRGTRGFVVGFEDGIGKAFMGALDSYFLRFPATDVCFDNDFAGLSLFAFFNDVFSRG